MNFNYSLHRLLGHVGVGIGVVAALVAGIHTFTGDLRMLFDKPPS